MKALAVMIAATCWVGSANAASSLVEPDEKAAHHAMEQQRKAAEAEMRRQADSERKMVEQQNRAMQEQMRAQKKFVETQQKAMHEQQKALQNQEKAQVHAATITSAQPHSTTTHPNPPHITTTQTTTPVYHAARPYYGHSYGHAYHRSYHNYRTTANRSQLDPQTRALQRLKTSLDHVRMGSPATPIEATSIKRALMGVVNVPRIPTIGSIQTLANHLADGLANRGVSSAQTGPMALTLLGALNSTDLANADLTEILNEHRSALKTSKIRPTEITPIMDSLKTVANQERSRH